MEGLPLSLGSQGPRIQEINLFVDFLGLDIEYAVYTQS